MVFAFFGGVKRRLTGFTRSGKNRAIVILIVCILLGFAIPVGLGVYHSMVRGGESYHLFYSFPSEKARPIIFYYGAGGIAKILDPNTLGVTIGLTNTDKKPHMLGFRLEKLPQNIHVHWSGSYTKGFNEEKQIIERVVEPKGRVSVHLTFFIEEVEDKPLIYRGYFKVYDLETGDLLLKIPIKILNVKASGLERR
jgi:hypothetical protein